MKQTIKKIIIAGMGAMMLVFSFSSVLHAQTSQCTNIHGGGAYEACCTGQSEFDSQTCIAYATAYVKQVDPSNPQCANIVDDNVYNQCCEGNDATDSPICVAYNNSTAADEGNNGNTQGVVTNNTQGVVTNTGAGNASPLNGANQALNIHLQNPLSVSTIGDAINLIMSVVIRIALPLIILCFIWSGLTFIFARGKPEEIKRAKNIFFYTVIGTLLILGAWAITNAIIGTVNSIIN